MNTANKSLLRRFFKLVEIKTKITSLFAFMLAVLYAIYLGGKIDIFLFGCFFVSMLLFDMCTTAINNIIGYRQKVHDLPFSYKTSLIITISLLISATLLGLILAYFTGFVVLALGAICFLCGIFYTYGPLPISALPFGEVISGLFYGYIIPFICLYIAMPIDYYITVDFSSGILYSSLDIANLFVLFFVTMPAMACTANIMLANNICDLESDVAVGRHTLVYYLGRSVSLLLFQLIYVIIFVTYALLLITLQLSWIVFVMLMLVAIPVQRNAQKFIENPQKETTFMNAIINFILIMTTVCAGLLLAILL